MPTKTVPSLVPVLVPFATSVRVAPMQTVLAWHYDPKSRLIKVQKLSEYIYVSIYVSLLNNKCLVWLLFIFISFCFVGFSGLQRQKAGGRA